MQQKRASELADDIALRLTKDSTRKAQQRALENSDETLYRQQQNRARMETKTCRTVPICKTINNLLT